MQVSAGTDGQGTFPRKRLEAGGLPNTRRRLEANEPCTSARGTRERLAMCMSRRERLKGGQTSRHAGVPPGLSPEWPQQSARLLKPCSCRPVLGETRASGDGTGNVRASFLMSIRTESGGLGSVLAIAVEVLRDSKWSPGRAGSRPFSNARRRSSTSCRTSHQNNRTERRCGPLRAARDHDEHRPTATRTGDLDAFDDVHLIAKRAPYEGRDDRDSRAA